MMAAPLVPLLEVRREFIEEFFKLTYVSWNQHFVVYHSRIYLFFSENGELYGEQINPIEKESKKINNVYDFIRIVDKFKTKKSKELTAFYSNYLSPSLIPGITYL
jgi:hypothetical protein